VPKPLFVEREARERAGRIAERRAKKASSEDSAVGRSGGRRGRRGDLYVTIASAPPTAPRARLQRDRLTAGKDAKNSKAAATGVLTAAAVVLPRRGRCGGGGIRGDAPEQVAAAAIQSGIPRTKATAGKRQPLLSPP